MFIDGVAVKGYQSLYDVKCSLGNFTVIYGESDVGKSAFYRAVKALVTSEDGDSFISHGKSSTTVALKLNSGVKVAWFKKKGKSGEYSCKVDEKTKLQTWARARKMPPDLAQLLRFGELAVDGEKFYPNFRSQFDRLFLLFESPGRRARVLGSLIANILLKAVKQANLERIRNDSDIRSLSDVIEGMTDAEQFDWEGFIRKVGVEKKVVEKLESGSVLMEQLRRLLQDKEEIEKLLTVKFVYLPKKVWAELDELVELDGTLSGLMARKHDYEMEIMKSETVLKAFKVQRGEREDKIKELEKKLTFPCPHCKKPISVMEVDID
jgi:energy-coupling factor transporter ATP-binding protein EcfA2